MDSTILVALVTGLSVAIPSVIATVSSNKTREVIQNERMDSMSAKIDALSSKVDNLSDFDKRLSLIEQEIKMMKEERHNG